MKYISILILALFYSCQSGDLPEDKLFALRSDCDIEFNNELIYTEDFNPYTYRNFYNGGGVAIADINNDGLLDVYLTGNMVDNKMYLNKGNFQFEDITEKSGLACPNVWSSGANFVDINADGLVDLYVCKAGLPEGERRYNELFINQGDLTFKEEAAAYGLDIKGLSIQSAFFDYDQDGDLDCYLLNNSTKSVGGFDLVEGKRDESSDDGNKLLENRNDYFYDVSAEAGIYTSSIGFGLGITLSDFNLDGWTDIYISNDFFERDYLYLNKKDGTFEESAEAYFQCLPMGAMGADIADLDNDLLPDLMVTEMLPSTVERRKTKALYEGWKKYMLAIGKGYYHQLPRNMLQKNMGDLGFIELGRKAGVEATDWSWSTLMQDFDNDGLKDIFVTNGIYKDLLDRDYLAFVANDSRIKNMIKTQEEAVKSMIDSMPSQAVPNFMFQNQGGFNFIDQTTAWGLDQASFSNGCAYGDLDNDGDLDLIVNNVNMKLFVYENRAESLGNNWIGINLKGEEKNTKAIGTKVIVTACGEHYMSEQFPSRGFQSSVSNQMTIGLGACAQIDSLQIIWPDGTDQKIKHPEINVIHKLNKVKGERLTFSQEDSGSWFQKSDDFDFRHEEQKFNQFNRERLLFKMNTRSGPSISTADLNGDKISDVFIGGAKAQNSVLFLSEGSSYKRVTDVFQNHKRSEVVESTFFDSDGDGDLDLYIAHGGTAFSPYAKELDDLIYINLGNGEFVEQNNAITFSQPIATGALAISDFDGDDLPDVLIGDQKTNQTYGSKGSVYLYRNLGDNQFELMDIPSFQNLGMITDAQWIDVNNDEREDLIVVGEWMGIKLFLNTANGFEEASKRYGLDQSVGIWNTVFADDLDQDGQVDIFLGNIGENNSLSIGCQLYVYDFDGNGSEEQILCELVNGKIYPVLDMDELVSQLPGLKRKFIKFGDYAKRDLYQMFDKESIKKAKVYKLETLESSLYFLKNGKFVKQVLPEEIQYSSVHSVMALDFDHDGERDLILGGNHYLVKPQYGRDDASKGWALKSKRKNGQLNFTEVEAMNISGEIRDFQLLDASRLLIGVNGQGVKTCTF